MSPNAEKLKAEIVQKGLWEKLETKELSTQLRMAIVKQFCKQIFKRLIVGAVIEVAVDGLHFTKEEADGSWAFLEEITDDELASLLEDFFGDMYDGIFDDLNFE
jgi:hypothetical protein